jgi:hypothetical protein
MEVIILLQQNLELARKEFKIQQKREEEKRKQEQLMIKKSLQEQVNKCYIVSSKRIS